MKILIEKENPVRLFERSTDGSAGYDIEANTSAIIKPNERCLIGTGLRMVIEPGYELQIRPRSGLALKKGVTVLNSPGTIDSDYRGEIGVILYNSGEEDFVVEVGDRIAQGVFTKYQTAIIEEIYDIDKYETERLDGGFGSTGK